MAAEIIAGKAVVHGVTDNGTPITITGYTSFLPESLKGSHNFSINDIKDGNLADAAAVATNEYIEVDANFTPTGATRATAATQFVFPAPLSKVTIANMKVGLFNGDWQYRGGTAIDVSQNGPAKISGLKIRKYVDAAQNASLTTTVVG